MLIRGLETDSSLKWIGELWPIRTACMASFVEETRRGTKILSYEAHPKTCLIGTQDYAHGGYVSVVHWQNTFVAQTNFRPITWTEKYPLYFALHKPHDFFTPPGDDVLMINTQGNEEIMGWDHLWQRTHASAIDRMRILRGGNPNIPCFTRNGLDRTFQYVNQPWTYLGEEISPWVDTLASNNG